MVYFGHPTVWHHDIEERIMTAIEELAGELTRD